MFSEFEIDHNLVRENLKDQGENILQDIASAYLLGELDDPQRAAIFCSLLACICEGKVTGRIEDSDKGLGDSVYWSLTEKYEAHLKDKLDEIASKNVVRGPW